MGWSIAGWLVWGRPNLDCNAFDSRRKIERLGIITLQLKQRTILNIVLVVFLTSYVYVYSQTFFVRKMVDQTFKRPIFETFLKQQSSNSFRRRLMKSAFANLPVTTDDLNYLQVWTKSWKPGRATLQGLFSSPQTGLHCVEINLKQTSFDEWRLLDDVTEIELKEKRCFNNRPFIIQQVNEATKNHILDPKLFTIERESTRPDGTLEIQGYFLDQHVKSYSLILALKNGFWVKSSVSINSTVFQ